MSDRTNEAEDQSLQQVDVDQLDVDTADHDEIEILEVVGLTEDSPAAEPVDDSIVELPEMDPADEEVTVDLDAEEAPGPEASEAPGEAGEDSSDRDQLLRLQADFDNMKKRLQREREEYVHQATATLVTKLLPVLDNFERALAAATSEQNADALKDGVILIFRQLLDELRKEGLEAIESVGEPFDPSKHDAVETSYSEQHPAHTVLEEFQRGYRLNSRLLRPALVRVSVEQVEQEAVHGMPTDGNEES